MPVKINQDSPDDRVERILEDPKTYFAQAREQARARVREDMARERRRRESNGDS